MKNYLGLKVPVRREAAWFNNLRNALAKVGVPVTWQKSEYHITVAFIKDDQHVEELRTAFGEVLSKAEAPQLTLDKVGVFRTMSGEELIVFLTSSTPSERFMSLVESLRSEVEKIGANMESNFRLHITLGRIKARLASLEQVEEVVKKIDVPPFTLTLQDAEYKFTKSCGNKSIQEWNLKKEKAPDV